MNQTELQDLIVVGGGINGAGIARDATGRGLKVTLCEMADFASATSSASSKLIHGGLRYLEHYEFGLVRKALKERELLWKSAPHIVKPLRFVLPHHSALRPALLIRAGLFLYDYIGGRKILPPTEKLHLRTDAKGKPLQSQFMKGFEYSDCWVDDARLVVLNVMDAKERGANVLKGWRCVSASREDGVWRVFLQNGEGAEKTLTSKALVNAGGAWAADLANGFEASDKEKHKLRLVKGSHIVLPRLYDGDHGYTFQEADGRIIFAIPYEADFTLVGTTDMAFEGDPASVSISAEEVMYLCDAIGGYLKKPVTPEQVVWRYSGVRPLVDDGEEDASQVTRDYILDLSTQNDDAPLLSVFGGKVTTYRKLAEQALEDLAPYLGRRPSWTGTALLPGGDIGGLCRDDFVAELQAEFSWAPKDLLARYTRLYGSRTKKVLEDCRDEQALGQYFGGGLYEVELQYLKEHEWATSPEDVLWRRTKLGLVMTEVEKKEVANWLRAN